MKPANPPTEFIGSIAAFEAWMQTRLGSFLVKSDLREKHRLMRKDAFLFLRGTCWRWAEIASVECPELNHGPKVASVGDAHVGNFGLWRDADGRLVWGVNDYDEAAIIPYRMDLARLLTSAKLARTDGDGDDALAEAAFEGYAAGLADPRPWVLEQDHVWLRELFAATDDERLKFWAKLHDAKPAKHVADAYRHALDLAVSGSSAPTIFSRRRAGVGSLGRARIVALTGDAGGPIAREAKALLPSCWDRESAVGEQFGLSTSRYRSPDPFLHLDEGIAVRRLAPNSRKIDLNSHRRRVRRRLVGAMARDIGAIHAADECAPMVLEHLRGEGHGWLIKASNTMCAATVRDWHEFRGATNRHGDLRT